MCKVITYKYRLKDSNLCAFLGRKAGAVNFVWNYANQTSSLAWKRDKRWLSGFDMCSLVAYTSKELELHGHTIQAVVQEHALKRDKAKRAKLKWRSGKKNLGWIPFKSAGVKVVDDAVKYQGRWMKFWKSRELPGHVCCGAFVQDASRRWYVTFVCDAPEVEQTETGTTVGIDLGFKTQITCSDGIKYQRPNITRKYEDKLAIAQRAGHKKRMVAIHSKIKNVRADFAHKASTEIVKKHSIVKVGNVSSKAMIARKKGFAKSATDAGWYQFKTLLQYKASRHGVDFLEVNEAWSTVTCSACGFRTGPSGLSALGVRAWGCSNCGVFHDRDINAARNIYNA